MEGVLVKVYTQKKLLMPVDITVQLSETSSHVSNITIPFLASTAVLFSMWYLDCKLYTLVPRLLDHCLAFFCTCKETLGNGVWE